MSELPDYTKWSDAKLHHEIMGLVELRQIPRSEESLKRIQRRMAHIVFEQGQRYEERHRETDQLETDLYEVD